MECHHRRAIACLFCLFLYGGAIFVGQNVVSSFVAKSDKIENRSNNNDIERKERY